MPVTPLQCAQLVDVNRRVNALPFNDVPGADEPPDWWTDQPMAGRSWVCRMYTEKKATELKGLGWPPLSLTTVLCWVEPEGAPPERTYHACLAVQPEGEPVATILDSRFDEPYLMSKPPADYRWDRRQVAGTVQFEDVSGVPGMEQV